MSSQVETKYQLQSGAECWYGSQLSSQEAQRKWVHTFSPQELQEIDQAVQLVLKKDIPIPDITREHFVLPTLGKKLEHIQQEIVNGQGFYLLKGLPVTKYTIKESAIAYWGIGTHIGVGVPQNRQGHLLGHVRDIGFDPKDPKVRIYTTNARQLFHTDSCDIVGLLCLHPAKSGGLSTISSSVTIYNEMLKRNPKWVELLSQPFYYDRKGEIPDGKGPHYLMPVFNNYKGQLSVIFAYDFIDAAQKRFPDIPRLTPDQQEALETIQTIASEKEVRLDMVLEQGDIQFIHNHQILHARTEYEDYEDPALKRHLLRLWLAPMNGRELPPIFAERYINIQVGTPRGGIRVPGAKLYAPLEPEQ